MSTCLALADAVGTPFYCYATATLTRHYRVFAEAFVGREALVCYAVKANSNQAVLKTLASLGAGMDIVSEGELRRARAAGVPGERIVFSGVGKTRAEMAAGLDAGILCFNVESEPEMAALSEVALSKGMQAPVSIRVNPDVDARTHRKISTGRSEDKFGVPISRAREVYAHAAGLPGLAVIGVDTHIGSQITELAPFDNAAQLLAELARDLMADGHRLRHIDLGGGLGIPYREDDPPPPDPLAYARGHPPPHGGSRPEARLRDRPHDRRQRRHPRHARHLREARRGQDLRRRRRRHERPDPPDALRRLSRHPAGGRAAAECAAADRRRGRAGLRERRLPRPRPRPAARRRRATSSPS